MEQKMKLENLHAACRAGSYEKAIFWIEVKRKSVIEVDVWGHNPLYYAMKSKNKKLINYIKEKMEEKNKVNSSPPPGNTTVPHKELPGLALENFSQQSHLSATQIANLYSGENIDEEIEEEEKNLTKKGNEKVETLRALFPDISLSTIESILSECQTLEVAVEILLSEGSQDNYSSRKNTSTKLDHQNAKEFPSLIVKKNNKKNNKKKAQTDTSEKTKAIKTEQGIVANSSSFSMSSSAIPLPASLQVESKNKGGDIDYNILSASNLKQKKLEDSYCHVEDELLSDDGWSKVSGEEEDYDVQSVVESEATTEDWDIYFSETKSEDQWEMLGEEKIKESKTGDEKWMIEEEERKSTLSYSTIVSSKNTIKSQLQPKSKNQLIKKEKEKENETKNDPYEFIDSSIEPKADDEFYFTKEGRAYGKATKTRRGHSLQPHVHRSGSPAGKVSF